MNDRQASEERDRTRGEVLGLGGWIWEHPELPAMTIKGLWPHAPDGCWAVGDCGLLAHWDGRRWTGGLPWFGGGLNAVWAARPMDVWFGGARLVHLQDGHWSVDPIELPGRPGRQPVLSLSGCAADDIWAVGSSFTLRFDGSRWRQVSDRGGQMVWARAPDDVWVAWASFYEFDSDRKYIGGQSGGGVRRFDGRTWREWDFGRQVLALDGTGPEDIWAAGMYGLVRHFDGKQWHEDTPAERHDWVGVCAVAPGDVWLVGAQRLDRQPVPLIFRRRRGKWGAVPGSERLSAHRLQVVRSGAPGDVWLGGWSEVYRSDGQEIWPVGKRSLPAYEVLLAIGGTSPDDLWAAGQAGTILHRDSLGWSSEKTGWSGVIWAMAARGRDEAWAAGSEGLVGRWDGRSWKRLEVPTENNLNGIVIDGAGVVWIAGERVLLRHDRNAWSRYDIPDARDQRILLASDRAGTAFALVPLWPKGGRLLCLGSGKPEPMGADLPVQPSALWIGAPGDFWIFHDDGVARGDGRVWGEALPVVARVCQAVGSGPEDLWLMTHDRLAHWNGHALTRRPWPFLQLNHLWRGPGCVYAVGANGAVLRLDE